MTKRDNTKILEEVKKNISDYETGYLEMDLGYKFRTRAFINVLFLYINSVDVKNPDILGPNNKNTFVYELQSQARKVKEQVRLDLKDINFMIDGASSLARFVIKAANRKILEENNFAEVLDEIPDNAVDYGSGFLKVWKVGGKLKMKSIDPFKIYFNQYDFKGGMKSEKFTRTAREIINDETYDEGERTKLKNLLGSDEAKWDETMVLFQSVVDVGDGEQEVSVCDTLNNLVLYKYQSKKHLVKFYKYDLEKRKGFKDALGIGCNERVFNKLVQSKVNRERMDRVLAIATKLPFQKEIDNEIDNMVGKEVTKLGTGVIMGHRAGKEIKLLDTGGVKQANLINTELTKIINTIGTDINVTEALQGNTLPSGTSGVLGNLLTENASSVLKEYKKAYANFLNYVYTDEQSVIGFIVDGIKSDDNLKKYLNPNDYRMVRLSIKRYLMAKKYIQALINNEPFDAGVASIQVDKEIKKKDIVPGKLLEQIREEIEGVRTYISGENVSKAQAVAFLRELQTKYATNPGALKDPFIISLIKKEAEYDAGISSLEIEQWLEEIPDVQAQPVA